MSFIGKILHAPPRHLNPWLYWVILLASLLEPLPVLGSFIPGQTLVILGGFFAKQGVLDFGDLVVFAAIGAILGDLVGYLVGKRMGDKFLLTYGKYFFLNIERFYKVKILLRKFAGRTLVFGRFNSVTRSFSPFLAGSTGVQMPKFLLYNVIGGFCWSLAFASIGHLFGKGFEIATRFISDFVFMGLLLSGIVLILFKLKNKGERLFNPKHRLVLILNVISTYLFFKMIDDVLGGETITKWDLWISNHSAGFRNAFTDSFMIFISNALRPWHLAIAASIVFLLLILNKSWYKALLLFSGMGGGLLINHVVKNFVHRSRPDSGLVETNGYSFPSTHATSATLFFCLMIFMFKEQVKTPTHRFLFVFGNIALFLLVGLSRIYLNVHWFSDVVGSISLSLFWLTLLILFFKNFVPGIRDEP